MGERDAARVELGVLFHVAGRYDAVADALDGAARTHLDHLTFGGPVAGRAHPAAGEALRSAVDALGGDVRTWARSAVEIASAMRGSADRYLAAETHGAMRLG
jgi:Excreted virulence factor EspC, type VII ESX diderm